MCIAGFSDAQRVFLCIDDGDAWRPFGDAVTD
jgi:hypothetical protein